MLHMLHKPMSVAGANYLDPFCPTCKDLGRVPETCTECPTCAACGKRVIEMDFEPWRSGEPGEHGTVYWCSDHECLERWVEKGPGPIVDHVDQEHTIDIHNERIGQVVGAWKIYNETCHPFTHPSHLAQIAILEAMHLELRAYLNILRTFREQGVRG